MKDKADNQTKHAAITGTVVSDKMDKTRVVEVKTLKRHPMYKKTYTVTKRYHVHDPENEYSAGDKVSFVPSQPKSKTKRFVIIGKA